MPSKNKKIVDFFFELGMLKRQKHRGFYLVGEKNPDSLADHTARTAIIAYVLANMEGDVDVEKTTIMALIHELSETRVGDTHKVTSRYVDKHPAEHKAFKDQMKSLPSEVSKKWQKYYNENEKRSTKEGIITKDADWLETAISARELVVSGHKGAQDWIDNVTKAVETKSAKQLIKIINTCDPDDWWKGLKKMTYKKLNKK